MFGFEATQGVRLVREAHDLPKGATGTVIGFYALREMVVVEFKNGKIVEVTPDEIEPLARD